MSLFLQQIDDLQKRVAALEQKILAAPPPEQPPAFSTPARVMRIVDAVASAHGLSVKTLLGHGHQGEFVRARHLAMFLAYATTPAVMREIGEIFDRDPSGVSYAVTSVRQQLETDPARAREINDWLQRFTPPTTP